MFNGYYLGADIQAAGEKKTGTGYRCLYISLNIEPLCTHFLLSFWKVGSRSEAISSVFPMLMCADVRSAGPQVALASPFQTGGRGSAETAHQGKGGGSERPMIEQITLVYF